MNVHKCGLFIDPAEPWLAASPDKIVIESTSSGQSKGCLEVKCPLTCEKTAFADACKSVAGFVLCSVMVKCSYQNPMDFITKFKSKCM